MFDVREGTVLVRVVYWGNRNRKVGWIAHSSVSVVCVGAVGLAGSFVSDGWSRVKPFCSFAMACDDSHTIRVIDGEVRVDEDEEVRHGLGQGQGVGKQIPGMRVGVENDGEERGCFCFILLLGPVCGVHRVHRDDASA